MGDLVMTRVTRGKVSVELPGRVVGLRDVLLPLERVLAHWSACSAKESEGRIRSSGRK